MVVNITAINSIIKFDIPKGPKEFSIEYKPDQKNRRAKASKDINSIKKTEK